MNDKPKIDWPSEVHLDGTCFWYQDGLLHRENNLPAAIFPDGECIWYKKGKRIKNKFCGPEEIEQYRQGYQKY